MTMSSGFPGPIGMGETVERLEDVAEMFRVVVRRGIRSEDFA